MSIPDPSSSSSSSATFSSSAPAASSSSPSSSPGRNRALHLRLSLTSATGGNNTMASSTSSSTPTSFKRSFGELFGGVEEDEDESRTAGANAASAGVDPTAVGGGSREAGMSGSARNGIGRNNKRQRSESCATASSSSSSSSSSNSNSGSSSVYASPSSSSISSFSNPPGASYNPRAQRIHQYHPRPVISVVEAAPSLPPRLPTPRLDDVQMSDISLLDDIRDSENPSRRVESVVTTTAATTATGGPTMAALPIMASSELVTEAGVGMGEGDLNDSGSGLPQRPPQVQHSGAVTGVSYQRHSHQHQREYAQMSTANNRNQPPSIPLALPAPIPISISSRLHAPLPNLPISSTAPSLPLVETSPTTTTTTAAVSVPHDSGSNMGASTTVTLDFRSTPSPPPPLSLSLSPRANLVSDSESSLENARQRTATHSSEPAPGDRFRATMERYNEFESAMAALRRSVSPVLPSLLGASGARSHGVSGATVMSLGMGLGHVQRRPQAQASPPRLPPLELSVDEEDEEEEEDDNDDEREQQERQLQQVQGTMNPRGGGFGRQSSVVTPSAGTRVDLRDDGRTSSLDLSHHRQQLHLRHLHHDRIHQTQHRTMSTSSNSSSAHNLSRSSSLFGSASSRTQIRPGGRGDDIVVDEAADELDEDEGRLTDELDDQEGSDHHAISTPIAISVGSTANVYPGFSGSSASSSSLSRAVSVRDAPPRLELELSGASAGFGRGVIDEDELEEDELEEDEGEGNRDETQRISSLTSTNHGPPPFRDRLDSALEALRSPSSPLVPGLNTSIATATDDTNNNININDNRNNGGNESLVAPEGGALSVEGLDHRRVSASSSSTAVPSNPGFVSVADFIRHAHHYWNRHQAIEDEETEEDEGEVDVIDRSLLPRIPTSSSTTTPASNSGFTSVADLIRASAARRRYGSRGEEEEELDDLDRRSLSSSSPPRSRNLISAVATNTASDVNFRASAVPTFFDGSLSDLISAHSNSRRSTSTSNSTSNTHSRSNSNSNATAGTNNSDMTASVATSYTLSGPSIVDFTRFQPPMLPPIMTDTRMDDVEVDYQDDNEHEEGEDEDEEEERRRLRDIRRRMLDGTVRDSRLHERIHQTRTMGRENVQLPEVPSPSLSGFYDWLEGASVNAGVASATVSAPVDATAAGSLGATSMVGAVRGAGAGGREGEASGSPGPSGPEQRHGHGSWEEDVLSGLMTTDLGLTLALPQQHQRDGGQNVATNAQMTLPQTSTVESENNVVDVDMELDREREREVERLPWTLGVPTGSSSSSRAAPPRLEFPRQGSRGTRAQGSRRHLIYDSDDNGWNPVHSQRQWQGEAGPSPAYTLSSASVSASSLPTTTPGFSSSLFSSPPSPPPPPPSTRINASPTTINHPYSSSSRIRLPNFGSTSHRAAASTERNTLAGVSLPPSLSLDLGLRDSVFDPTTSPPDAIAASGTRTNTDTITTATINAAANAHASPEPTAMQLRNDSLIQLTGPPTPEPSLSVPPPPAPRLPLIHHLRGFQHVNVNPGWHGSLSERRFEHTIVQGGGDDSAVGSSSSRVGRAGAVGGLTTRIGSDNSLVAENAAEIRRRNAREDVFRRLSSRLGGSSSRDGEGVRSMERNSLFGGLALPPRNVHSQAGRSGSSSSGSGSMGSNMGVSMYPGVGPPPPRPRLHSVRQAHAPESSGLNVENGGHNSVENRRPPITSQEAMFTMHGLRSSPDGTGPGPAMRLHTESEGGFRPENPRNARTSVDSLSSGSSMSVESFIDSGSGMSSASVYGGGGEHLNPPSRTVFLDTELPSPGLGGLFDSLGANPTATAIAAHGATGSSQTLVDSLRPVSAAASSTVFNTSTSSDFPSAGRLTPSSVRTSDDDSEARGVVHESTRLQLLTGRLGHMRDEMLNDVLRWDRDDESVLSDEMEAVGEGSNTVNVIRLDDQRPLLQDLHRSDLFPTQLAAATNNTSPPVRAGGSQGTRNGVIDPALFDPGPFRNTMVNLATRAREYAAQGSSTRSATSMSSPIARFSSSTSSPLSPLPTYTFSAASRARQSSVSSPQSPPVIPPLSFENDAHNEANNSTNMEGPRSEVQEPLLSTARQWITDSDELLRRQQRMRNLLRSYQNGRPPTSTLSASSSSVSSASSHGGRVSWSQLERSPERPESTTGLPESGSSSSTSDIHSTRRGDAEGLHDAIRVLRADGLSVDRSLQFLDRFRQQRAEGSVPTLNGRGDEGRNEDQERGGGRYHDEALRFYARMRESEVERERQREARNNLNVPRWVHSNNSAPTPTSQHGTHLPSGSTVEGASFAVGATSRNTPRYPYPSWHDTTLSGNTNNDGASTEEDMRRLQAFLESVSDSESDVSDNDQDNFIQAITRATRHPRPTASSASLSSASTTTSTTATVGRNNDSSRNGRLRRQGRLAMDIRGNPINGGMAGGMMRSNQAENAGADNNGSGVGVRILRERMLQRLRANPSDLSPGAPTGGGTNGRRFVGGFARRFGNLGDYLDDDEFDASYESLLALQDALGEVKQKSTPEAVLRKLKKGKYREWAEEGTETRCPICLEDYEMEDDVLKSGNCSHWMHKPCLETWFKKANTCPVCRMDVEPRPPTSALRGRYGRFHRSDRWRNAGTPIGSNGPLGTSTPSEGVAGSAGSNRTIRTTETAVAGPSGSNTLAHSNETTDEHSITSSMRFGGSGDSMDFDPSGNDLGGPFF